MFHKVGLAKMRSTKTIVSISMIFMLSTFFLAFSQESEKHEFSPISEKTIEEGDFYLPPGTYVRQDVSLLSRLTGEYRRISFDDDSGVYVSLDFYLKRLLKSQYIPGKEFIKENSFFYSVSGDEAFVNTPWSNGYDVVYLPYKVENLKVLVAITQDDAYGATYVFIKRDQAINPATTTKAIFLPEVCDLMHFEQLASKPEAYPKPVIQVYAQDRILCVVRPNVFSTERIPVSTALSFNEWFNRCKESDKINRESKKRHEVIQKLVDVRREKCTKLIATESGRLELLAMLTSDEGKEEFDNDTSRYNEFRALPFETLRDYYWKQPRDDKYGYSPVWPDEVITPAESKALRALLQSEDKKVKEYALQLIEAARTRSLLPDLLKMCVDKDLVPNLQMLYIVSNESNAKPRIYNYNVYRLIGIFGDEKTLETLKELQKDDKLSAAVKSDIQLACEDIQRNIAQHEREEHSRLDKVKLIREGKLAVPSESQLWIDAQIPAPEPVSEDGFRNWETTDGLFKTTAKLTGITGKDIKLQRKDGKTISIELDSLRQQDQEYARELLAPKPEKTEEK
ncbi:MAG: HEAT repeat domain-containing protein [Thermoguttaceae bacterium]